MSGAEDGQSRLSTPPRVLIIVDDAGIATLVNEICADEGYAATIVRDQNPEDLRAAVERLQPDCVLLDGGRRGDYGDSWTDAAWMTEQIQAVPVIMFSANRHRTPETARTPSDQRQTAGFAAVLQKPFDLEQLVQLVAVAVSHSPFRRVPGAEGAP